MKILLDTIFCFTSSLNRSSSFEMSETPPTYLFTCTRTFSPIEVDMHPLALLLVPNTEGINKKQSRKTPQPKIQKDKNPFFLGAFMKQTNVDLLLQPTTSHPVPSAHFKICFCSIRLLCKSFDTNIVHYSIQPHICKEKPNCHVKIQITVRTVY